MADQDESKKKRRLRAPSETLREKATRQDDAAKVVKPEGKVRRVLKAPFRGIAWLSHRPPLKPIGHGLRWFFSLRVMRFLGKVLGINYVVSSWQELKQVTWPTGKQSRRLTVAVIIFSVIFGAFIAGVDFGLSKLFKQVILKG